jgi:hypothetical protein
MVLTLSSESKSKCSPLASILWAHGIIQRAGRISRRKPKYMASTRSLGRNFRRFDQSTFPVSRPRITRNVHFLPQSSISAAAKWSRICAPQADQAQRGQLRGWVLFTREVYEKVPNTTCSCHLTGNTAAGGFRRSLTVCVSRNLFSPNPGRESGEGLTLVSTPLVSMLSFPTPLECKPKRTAPPKSERRSAEDSMATHSSPQ